MARSGAGSVLAKKAKVRAAVELRDVPAGTPGKVVLVNGLSWIRYWVRFDNGVTMGSVNRAHLATPAEWELRLAGGGDGADDAVAVDGAAEGEVEAEGEGVAVNGVMVPAKLIERAKAARARLSA